ncbi:MAG: 3-hydroxyacyl-CoA dehydrogenase family protein [Luteitalea sp.]|nr:3-hydroxyacyl-CoA dehydrogenase family protein [Luteitalea sp.]
MKDVQSVGVVGLGYLGRGIAGCLLGHELSVVGYDVRSDAQSKARASIQEALDELVRYAGFDAARLAEWPARYRAAASLDDLAECEVVIESVFEDLEVKHAVLDELEAIVSPSTLLGTNTSALPISQLQKRRRHPERLLGMHFCPPVHASRFLELVPGEHTAPDAMTAAAQLGRRIGKDPSVLRKDIPGFVNNRLAYAIFREALFLIEAGVADAATIDRAFRHGVGTWSALCGPLRWIDISGGPALYATVMEGLLPTLSRAAVPPEPIRRLSAEGARGSSGHGFYEYSPEDARHWETRLHQHIWSLYELMKKDAPHEEETSSG